MNMDDTLKNNSQVKEYKMLSKDKNNMIFRYVMCIPMMTDREAITQIKIIDNKDEKDSILCWLKTIDHKDYPEQKKPIRIDMFKASKCWD